jgi:hypothetical protein
VHSLPPTAAAKKMGEEMGDAQLAESFKDEELGASGGLRDKVPAPTTPRAPPATRKASLMTSQTLEALIDTTAEFFKRQPTSKCAHCGANNPTVKREGCAKVFLAPLPAKKRMANAALGTPILSVLHRIAGACVCVCKGKEGTEGCVCVGGGRGREGGCLFWEEGGWGGMPPAVALP